MRSLVVTEPRMGWWWLVLWLAWPSVAFAEAGDDRLGLALSVESVSIPSVLCPGDRRGVPMVVRNEGSATWRPGQRDFLAYHWRAADGTVVEWDGDRTPLPADVAPGQKIEVRARLRAPTPPGRYRLQWAIVREGQAWSEAASEDVDVRVEGDRPALAWSRVGGGLPGPLSAGQTVVVPLALRNEGCAAWSVHDGDHLAYHWYDLAGQRVVQEGRRTPMPALEPGQRGTIEATVRAPPVEGRYLLQWRPVREGLGWFPEDWAPILVEVSAPALAWSTSDFEFPTHMEAQTQRKLSLWVRNEGTEEWTAERADKFSSRWLDESGAVVAEGVREAIDSPWLPGDEAPVEVSVVAPSMPGRYRLVVAPLREGVTWFDRPEVGSAEAWIEVTAPALTWAVVQIDAPDVLWAHRTANIRVVVRNTGIVPWSPRRGDRLSYRWLGLPGAPMFGDGLRTVLAQPVQPGESVTLWARVAGPEQPGRYTLQFEMVREHVRWLGPPTEGEPRVFVRVERKSTYAVILLGLLGFGALGVARGRWGAGWGRWWVWRVGWALWAGAAVIGLEQCFVDRSGAEPWGGAQWVAVGPAGLMSLLLLPWPVRGQRWMGTILLGGLTALILADLAYLHFFGSIVPLSAVRAVHHLADAESTVWSLLKPTHGWLWVVPVLAVGMGFSWPRQIDVVEPSRPWRGLGVVGALCLGGAWPLLSGLRDTLGSGVGSRVFSEEDNVGRLGLIGAHLFALAREAGPWSSTELTPAQQQRLTQTLASMQHRRRVAAAQAPGFGAAAGFDIVLIQVEALQDWVVEAQVDGQAIMPFLASSDSSALYFDQVFDQTGQGRTSDAEYVVLNAGYPPARGALAFLYEDNDFYTLAHVLAQRGYSTQSAHPYKRGFWNRAQLHPRYGFERSWFRRELGPGPSIGWGLSDAAFFERMQPKLAAASRPSFTFLITLSLHHPYESFPEAFKVLDLGALEHSAVGNYLHAMHHFDAALAEMMEGLRREGRLRHTMVAVYGDHVTGLGEPPAVVALARWANAGPTAHIGLHRVPVFIWVGSGKTPSLRGRHSTVGGQVDIAATVLHLAGVDDPRPAGWGRPLLGPGPGMAVLPNKSAVDDRWIFVAQGPGIPRGGGCFERVGGTSVPRARCTSLREQAQAQLEGARLVLTHDLHRSKP